MNFTLYCVPEIYVRTLHNPTPTTKRNKHVTINIVSFDRIWKLKISMKTPQTKICSKFDVLKFQLVQYNQFYDGKNQQDSSECLLMLIEIINKGSVPYYGSHVSNSTGVSLSDILFSFMLEKYIVCNVCGLRSPSIESSRVLYISPTHTSSMQELIMQGLQQKLEKSCFRCNKNTWHVESNHILQPPNYLIIVVNRFRYINNQFAKDKCSIPMDMTVVLGYHKFSLQATIDHHGPSIYSGHYTTSVNCCNRTFYCNDNKITEFDKINTKNSSTAYVVIYKLIT